MWVWAGRSAPLSSLLLPALSSSRCFPVVRDFTPSRPRGTKCNAATVTVVVEPNCPRLRPSPGDPRPPSTDPPCTLVSPALFYGPSPTLARKIHAHPFCLPFHPSCLPSPRCLPSPIRLFTTTHLPRPPPYFLPLYPSPLPSVPRRCLHVPPFLFHPSVADTLVELYRGISFICSSPARFDELFLWQPRPRPSRPALSFCSQSSAVVKLSCNSEAACHGSSSRGCCAHDHGTRRL